ncbi:MAG: redoxin domain-containing protein [Deltaproteobacteria bacterium]|nr:redoxin domain-containing protein [Deltaproteobacteria bacterium]
MVAAGGFLVGAILFAQLAQPIHGLFDPLQVEGLLSIKQLSFERQVEDVPMKVPDLAITTIDGRQIFLKELSNQNELVVINFWATWCIPCTKEMPDFEKVYRAYRHKKVVFLGIATQDLTPAVRDFVSKLDITYEIAVDAQNKIASAFGGVKALPTTIFVNSKNSIVKTHKGYMAKRELEGQLKKLLRE